MLDNPQQTKILIRKVAEELQLEYSVIEKDLHVTQALQALSKVSDENFTLVFQGGTSLAKAHKIIQRMSEDCDFRMQLKTPTKISKEKQRKLLRNFRHNLLMLLKEIGLKVATEELRVKNEGQFMSVRARYDSLFPDYGEIKPYIALEFFLAKVKTPIEAKQVTTLIKQTLGDEIAHPEFSINCVSVIETAAEKWVALTRRIATMKYRKHYRDPNLVRHLYDLYLIEQNGLFNHKFPALVAEIVQNDRKQYKNHNDDYYQNPIKEIKRALHELNNNPEIKDHWNKFINWMVYSPQKPTYQEVIATFMKISREALQSLAKTNFI